MELTSSRPANGPARKPPVDAGSRRVDWTDVVFALLLAAGAVFAYRHTGGIMNYYDTLILGGGVVVLAWMGWLWRPLRSLMIAVTISGGIAVLAYSGDLARGDQAFFLKYLLSSQSAILWMCMLFVLATACYWIGLVGRSATGAWLGTALSWGAVFAGLTGLLVRWHESYLLSPDIGHIPVSNLYEVFVLFSLITALFYLYYEQKYDTRSLGGFVMLVITSAVAFLLWYTFDRGAQEIQPLVPALQILDDIMYKAIAVGFAFFTVATILGALWAADAWGAYWQWDPKETWALIVWLNYAAWLHMRMMKGLRGNGAAYWALVGLLVTGFAFLGVNMFLSGLHSYGEL